MLKFLVYRVATIVPVLLGVSVVVFLMMKLIPGDPGGGHPRPGGHH